MAHFTMEQIFNKNLKLVETWSTRAIRVRATKTNDWQMSVDAGKPLRNYAAVRTQCVNIMLRLDKGFCYLNRCQWACTTRAARSAVDRGVRLARLPRRRLISLARRPPAPATPTPHSAPSHRCIVNTTGRPSAPDTDTATADQTGPRALCTAPTQNFTTATYLGALQKINNFPFLKKTRKQIAKRCRQPRYQREQWTADKRRTFLVSS